MLKLFYKMLKDQTGLAFVPILIIAASLISVGTGLWSVGTEGKKAIDNKKELANIADKDNDYNLNEIDEQTKADLVNNALANTKFAGEVIIGQLDGSVVIDALAATGVFDTEKEKTIKIDKLDPPQGLTDEEFDRMMELTEDQLDRLLELTDDELDIPEFTDEEINRLLEETGNLDYGIKKVVEKKVELNSGSETTPQEKKAIVDEAIKNIQKAEDSNNKVDLNSSIQTILKGADKLADQKLIDLKKALARNQLSNDYNSGIINKYEEYKAQGYGITDTEELAEAKRRLAGLYDESKILEANIKELEDAKQIPAETTRADTDAADDNAEDTDSTTTIAESTTTTTESTSTSGSTTTSSSTTTTTSTSTTLPEYISMYGSINGYSNSMNLSINLITGNVSGGINLVYSQTETSGDTTMTCTYSIKGSISGQMDLETRQINGHFSGNATALTEGCYGKDLSYSISGKLNESYSSASGSASNGWSWSVYK